MHKNKKPWRILLEQTSTRTQEPGVTWQTQANGGHATHLTKVQLPSVTKVQWPSVLAASDVSVRSYCPRVPCPPLIRSLPTLTPAFDSHSPLRIRLACMLPKALAYLHKCRRLLVLRQVFRQAQQAAVDPQGIGTRDSSSCGRGRGGHLEERLKNKVLLVCVLALPRGLGLGLGLKYWQAQTVVVVCVVWWCWPAFVQSWRGKQASKQAHHHVSPSIIIASLPSSAFSLCFLPSPSIIMPSCPPTTHPTIPCPSPPSHIPLHRLY